MSDPQPDLPASLREAIECEAEQLDRLYARIPPGSRVADCVEALSRIARLTLEAERQRQTQLSTAEWLQQQTLISDLYRASAERQQEIAMDALRDREDAIRRAQRDPAPPRDDKEPKP